jgi:hypothetical protein
MSGFEEAKIERLTRIEEALAAMGVTPEDIFFGEVRVSLRTTTIARNVIVKIGNPKRQKAVRMIMDGFSDREIFETTGIMPDDVRTISDRLDAILEETLAKYIERGFRSEDFEDKDLSELFVAELVSSMRKSNLTLEKKAAAVKKLLDRLTVDFDAGERV